MIKITVRRAALALLMKDGFSVEDIGHYDLRTSFVLYTLVR